MDNPIPLDSSPILSCTVSFSPAIDIDIEIVTEWSGPTYGLGEYITTEPVSNSSAEVPTYTSTARLDAPGTFYDSGNYNCSVVANPLTNLDFIHSSPAVSSQLLSGKSFNSLASPCTKKSCIYYYHHSLGTVLFLAPRRPHLNRIQVGHNWIYITWNRSLADNVSSYQVGYSYTGACRDINQQELLLNQIVGGRNSSYNITGLRGYSNYNISLTSINDTGRSPPNIALVLTDTTGM